MFTRKLTGKARTTLPKAVRTAIGATRRAPAAPALDPFATFGEWQGEADTRAYADL
jgi:antitoxin PrlF